MKYDFSKFFNNSDNEALDDFIEQYTTYINTHREEDIIQTFRNHYSEIFDTLSRSFEEKEMLTLFENLAKFKISLDLPYVIVTNELFTLKNIILTKMLNEDSSKEILKLISLFKKINDKLAYIYLTSYIEKLLTINNVRISSFSDLIDKSIIKYYESHLIWISDLAVCIRDKNQYEFPELDEQLCHFGQWLHSDAKKIIQNDTKHNNINTLHSNLHFFGRKIHNYVEKDEYHLLITYLEKCELISLNIGAELALINNILLNRKVTKDALTGALSRESLSSIFESQYELSLATDSPFVLAMCDLDNFKSINDTYGHIAGDKLLQKFVSIVKEHLRNSDIIVRYGGEEFIILLPTLKKNRAFDVLEKIRKSFEENILYLDEQEIKATVSIGITEINPEDVFNQIFLEEHVAIADKKLYRAKNSGRNKVIAI